MAEGCMYCEAGDERRLELMTPIVDLKVSSLHFYREQSYPGRCVLVYHKHIQKLTVWNRRSIWHFRGCFESCSKADRIISSRQDQLSDTGRSLPTSSSAPGSQVSGRNRLGKDVSDDAGGSQNFDGGRRSG